MKIETEALVIGGGATGTGVVRDLAMRGFKAVLVEKGDLTHGTTGRYHGLLHSGGRYVVRDPQAARECIAENRILRQIMPQCIEDTGGFFVLTEHDDPDYAPQFLAGCRAAGIPVEELSVAQMLRAEPLLNPRITRCFRVPDGSADSFLAAELNAVSAQEHGAQILNYHKIVALLRAEERIVGVVCEDLVHAETVEIPAEIVVNASGAWAGKIARLAGLEAPVIPGKGAMLTLNHRIVNTVINRCKFPSDGDILVPAHTVAVIGTTDIKVADPDHFAIEPWEVELMLAEGEKLVPGFKQMRVLRAWAGVRPLYQDTSVNDTRAVTRAFVLLDHEQRDQTPGMITITGGKWTTYRKMAEAAVDLVCQKLRSPRPCRTHLEVLPDPPGGAPKPRRVRPAVTAGHRLAEVEQDQSYGKLICECELVTEDDAVRAILHGSAKTIDDLRRDLRIGMGPCQGGFCAYRIAGLLHRLQNRPVEQTNLALRDFLQERWKGLLPILWGQQLRQERLDELIYLSTLNADHLPGPRSGPLSPELYSPPDIPAAPPAADAQPSNCQEIKTARPSIFSNFSTPAGEQPPLLDVLVIGAGLAGLTAAWIAARRGLRVRLIAKGWGALYWQPGCIDVLGYDPNDRETRISAPVQALPDLLHANPQHPYALAGLDRLERSLAAFSVLCQSAGYPLSGSLEQNWLLPTALGAQRPTALAPETMIAGDLTASKPALIVGFAGFLDFYPELIADNLSRQGVPAQGLWLSLPEVEGRRFVNALTLANLFDDPRFVESVAEELLRQISKKSDFQPERIGFPAVLGLDNPRRALEQLEISLGLPVFEIPTLPPSIPGMRLCRLLVNAIHNSGGKVYNGLQAVCAERENGKITGVWSEAAARKTLHRARSYCLASGGLLGGGFFAAHNGLVSEQVFNLPVAAPASRHGWLNREFLSGKGHPIFHSGLRVNRDLQPLSSDGQVFYENLHILGGALDGFDPIRERSLEGVGLASGFLAGELL